MSEEEEMGVGEVGRGKVIPIEWLRALRTSAAAPERAQDQEHLLADLREKLKDLPDVREEKVIEAKLRISSGYYNRPEVRREVLRSVLESLLPNRSGQEDPDAGPQS